MIKLKRLLFESVSGAEFVDVLRNSTVDDVFLDYIRDPQDFYDMNKKTIDSILKDADEFKFLGAGVNGAAYSLGDRVLKIEPGNYRAETIATGLYGKKPTGIHHPAIYATGRLRTALDTDESKKFSLGYAIMEKFEIPSGEDLVDLDKLIQKIYYWMLNGDYYTDENGWSRRKKYSKEDIKKELAKTRQDVIDRVGEKLRLKDGWLEKLIDHMYIIQDENLADFHAGNIGVRRMGPEGDLVFFD